MTGPGTGGPMSAPRLLARTGGPMTYGVMVPHFGSHASRRRILEGAELVERLGFDAVWVRDHLLWTPHAHESSDITFVEPLTVLAAIAARTERVQLGTAVLIPLRWPLKLAQDLAALSFLSDGRVIAGLGTGHKHDELAAVGFDADQRREVLAETIEIVRRIWSTESVSYDGEIFSFTDVAIEPKPAQPIPLWYGGTTQAALRRVVGAYDGWLPGGLPLATMDKRIDYLRGQCADVGRDLPVIGTIPRLSLSRDRAAARAAVDIGAITTASEGSKWWVRPAGGFRTFDDIRGLAVVGEPEEVAEQIVEIARRPIDHFVFDLRGQFDKFEESLEMIPGEILPLVEKELGDA